MMKVGIDARMINYSGIGRYIRSLLNEYSKMPGAGELFIFGDLKELAKYKHFKVKKSTAPIYSIGEQISLPLRIRKLPIFHSPHYNAPLFYRGKLIVTIQDIIHIKFPEYLQSRKAYLYARYMYRHVTEKAARLITASEHTKSDLVECFSVSREKIKVIPFGVGEEFHPVEDEDLISSFRKKYDLPQKFILYVGNLKSHKNLSVLLKAFDLLRREKKIEESLVLTTGGKPANELVREASDKGMERWVNFLPFIPDEELPLLYNCAKVFTFPSLYEGFGLPPLEAMASGVPVVCSNAASLPEVIGEAAIMCDPGDYEAFADGICRLLADDSLRSKLIIEGRKRAKLFSWAETAKKTIAVYRELLEAR